MSVIRRLKQRKAHWDSVPPADESAIQALVEQSGLELPQDYLAFLRFSNGGDGHLGVEPGWFQIWPAEEVVEANRDLDLEEELPGFFGFGGNGGGEMFAFDMRGTQPWPIVMVPYNPLEPEFAIKIADNFLAFADAMGTKLDDD
ncbi:MAG: SMI1/KNR4 family protein [Acidobacteria bacterium]|nr:SMI1/KNR4 family protein [Acidobacteriota bacterium]